MQTLRTYLQASFAALVLRLNRRRARVSRATEMVLIALLCILAPECFVRASLAHTDRRQCARARGSVGSCPSPRVCRIGVPRPPSRLIKSSVRFANAAGVSFGRRSSFRGPRLLAIVRRRWKPFPAKSASFLPVGRSFTGISPPIPSESARIIWEFAPPSSAPLLACNSLVSSPLHESHVPPRRT